MSGEVSIEVAPGDGVAMGAEGEEPRPVYVPPDLYPTLKLTIDALRRGEFDEETVNALEAGEPLTIAVEGAHDIHVHELRAARERAADAGRDLIVEFVESHGRGGPDA
jgi:hypothetical protein